MVKGILAMCLFLSVTVGASGSSVNNNELTTGSLKTLTGVAAAKFVHAGAIDRILAEVLTRNAQRPAQGVVDFYDGSTLIASRVLDRIGVAHYNTTTLALGVHSITAVYRGQGGFSGSTSPAVSVTVVK